VTYPADYNRMVLYCKEDDNTRKGDATVECSREDVVVLLPPSSLVPPKIVHKSNGEIETAGVVSEVGRCPE